MSFSPMKAHKNTGMYTMEASANTFEPQDSLDVENRSVFLGLPDADDKVTGVVLSAHDISYNVKVRRRCCMGVETKQILKMITGVFKPGLNAIMGATGSGKTTFLNVIAARLDKRAVEGTILMNGKPIPYNFKCMVGYVVQENIVMGTLTVRENLAFSAALRLPNSISKSEREERIEKVIKELGLQHCADTKIGTPFLQGVSKGEKKLCNIGMELLISPLVLFLDEPTSGLDASTSNTVMMFLKRLSKQGRTIIFSIHQPRYSIYSMFDNLMLLSGGQTVFHGKTDETLDFFEAQGYKCQEHNNPSDFFLDVIKADEATLLQACTIKPTFSGDKQADRDAIQDKLITGYRESEWHTRLQREVFEIYSRSEYKDEDITTVTNTIEFATSFPQQFVLVAGRTWKNIVRNPELGLAVIISSLIISLLVIGVFWQIGEDTATGIADRPVIVIINTSTTQNITFTRNLILLNRIGLFFFLIFFQMSYTFLAAENTIKERVVVMHENISGFYRMSVYFLVNVFVDIIPLRLAALIPSCTIMYYGIGMRSSFDAYLLFILTMFIMTMASAALSFLMGTVFERSAAAHTVVTFVIIIMGLFSGAFVNHKKESEWTSWMRYFSIFNYGCAALYSNEIKDRRFCVSGSNGTMCKDGNQYLSDIQVDYKTSWDFWHNHLALTLLATLFFSMAYVQLKRRRMNN